MHACMKSKIHGVKCKRMRFTDWSKMASNMNERTQILKEEEEICATVQSSEMNRKDISPRGQQRFVTYNLREKHKQHS